VLDDNGIIASGPWDCRERVGVSVMCNDAHGRLTHWAYGTELGSEWHSGELQHKFLQLPLLSFRHCI